MAHLYITDNGSVLSIDGGRFVIKQKDEMIRSVPKESVESISIFGNSSITTPCIQALLSAEIPVCFFSSKGKYYGRLYGVDGDKISLLKRQFCTFDDNEFSTLLSTQIVSAKIHNQIVILKRYIQEWDNSYQEELAIMMQMEKKVLHATSSEEAMGCEGMAAKMYFKVLGEIVRPDFRFYGRSKRPPRDPFNSLLSLGYTLLLHEIMAKVETAKLSPYCGILHSIRDGSPALCSDLMEEWRPVIVDSTVLSMVQGNEICLDDFVTDNEATGVYLTNDALRKFINKFERKLNTKNKYLEYDNSERSFRQAMHVQCAKLTDAIKGNNPIIYRPVRIR